MTISVCTGPFESRPHKWLQIWIIAFIHNRRMWNQFYSLNFCKHRPKKTSTEADTTTCKTTKKFSESSMVHQKPAA